MTKLAIAAEVEKDKYEHHTVLKCWKCNADTGLELPPAVVSTDPHAQSLVDGVVHALSSARQSEVQAWEEEIAPCEHTRGLAQVTAAAHEPVEASGRAHCARCELKENLWLCLTCGSLGCGRQQFGGVSGNGHGLGHYEETGHPVSVKLGTITPEGGAGEDTRTSLSCRGGAYFIFIFADIYCYRCNDAKEDPNLAVHLAAFGINVKTQTKTEKSMTELVCPLTGGSVLVS